MWSPEKIWETVKRVGADIQKEQDRLDKEKRIVRMLEDIANDWEGTIEEPEPWLLWGNKVKCPRCGAVKGERTHFCPECGKETNDPSTEH